MDKTEDKKAGAVSEAKADSKSDEIEYKFDVPLETDDIVELYAAAGLERPIQDKARIRKMFDNSNLVVSAWRGKQLVGVSRALTDFAFVCYLSDLAVRRDLQKGGIGKKLIALTHEKAGVEENRLLLLSAPSAMEYYPKVGLAKVDNGFTIARKR